MDLLYNHLYKPKRILYYIPASFENKAIIYSGEIPDELKPYNGQFGTYDCPGLFRILDGNEYKEVIGIEFRPDDDRLKYPTGLKSIILDSCFMISAFLTKEAVVNDEKVDECIEYIKSNASCTRFYTDFIPQSVPEIIQIHNNKGKSMVYVKVEDIAEDKFFKYKDLKTQTEKELYFTAFYDPIIEYYNWNHITPYIEGFGFMGVQDYQFVHFDIKDFKALNIIYGHDTANKVLRRVADHMQEQDWIYFSCRCHNDNFAMMIKDMPEEETKEKLFSFFNEISGIEEDKHYKLFYRCGVVPMRNSLQLGDRVADGAKQAQRLGTTLNTTEVLYYTDAMHDELDWAKKIKAYLEVAIENDEFLLYLQPKYAIDSETISGAEALVRWNYMGNQILSPFRFIPIFEKDGSIGKVDDIVLSKTCECLNKWKEEGKPLFPISVNLSRKRMENPNLIDHLTNIVDRYGVDHSLIDFELTESAAYDHQEYMITVITELKNRGFKISMDDFGTGYSSLSLLTSMPIDTLKIDKSFVDGIGTDKETYRERAVVEHIISMAKALKLHCLAEGAEEKTQVERLREFGCDLVQGYYYSRPVPVEEYEKMI